MDNTHLEITDRKLYRATAGIILMHDDHILLCKAVGGYWTMPQGGIKSYETPIEAAKRELKEEVDVDSSAGVWSEESPWRVVILPPEKRQSRRYKRLIGQKYKWFVCKCTERPTVSLNIREFRRQFIWTTPSRIIKMSASKAKIYEDAFKYFGIAY